MKVKRRWGNEKMVLLITTLIMMVCQCAFAAPYPAALENGKLVFVAGNNDVGIYTDRSSAFVEVYTPHFYQVRIKTVVLKDGKVNKENAQTHHFRYERDTK